MTRFRHKRPGRARQARGTVPRAGPALTAPASARPRRRLRAPRAPRTSASAIRLALAPSSRCPNCGRESKTVQGVCADCWASKGGRQFWVRKTDQGWPRKLSPVLLGAALAALPTAVVVLLWTLG